MTIQVRCPRCQGVNAFEAADLDTTVECQLGCGRSFLLRPVRRKDPATASRPVERDLAPGSYAALESGDTFAGLFEIRRRIDRGNFGTVYQAFEIEAHREVALKIPFDSVQLNDQFMRRFRSEATLLRKMKHPNIVGFYDARLDKPPAYLVTEYIKGTSLSQMLSDARASRTLIDRELSIRIAIDLAGALHHAHRQGVIHRDIKPANILIRNGDPILVDFGLARSGDPSQTQAGARVGTPFYMSPEQVNGRQEDVKANSDQYALGVVLYELLCGKLPIKAEGIDELYHKIRKMPAPPPSLFEPSIPKELEAICLKALEKRPDRRWRDCAEFATRLEDFLESTSIHARSDLSGSALVDLGFNSEETPPSQSSDSPALAPVSGRLRETVAAPAGRIAVGVKRIGARAGPMLESVRPIRESLGTSVHLTTSLVRKGAPRWTAAAFEFLKELIDRFNDLLRRVEPEPPPAPSPAPAPELGAKTWVAAVARPASPVVAPAAMESLGPISLARSAGTGTGVRGSTDSGDSALHEYLSRLQSAHEAWLNHDRESAREHLDRCPTAPRGWEWAYLRALTRSHYEPYQTEAGTVSAVAFHPDGRRVASAGERELTVWDLEGKLPPMALGGHSQRIGSVAFSADGAMLATSGGYLLRAWELATGREVVSWRHEKRLTQAAFSPDGDHLIVGSVDSTVRILEARTGAVVRVLEGHGLGVHALAVHRDGRIAVGSGDGSVTVWDRSKLEPVARLVHSDSGAVLHVAFHPDGGTLVTAGAGSSLKFWDARTYGQLSEQESHGAAINAVAYHPGGRWVVSTSSDRKIRVGEAVLDRSDPSRMGREVFKVVTQGPAAETLAFGRDGRIAMAGGGHRGVRLWEIPALWATLAAGHAPPLHHEVAVHPDGRRLALIRPDGCVEIRDPEPDAPSRILSTAGALSLAFHPDGERLAVGTEDGSVAVWDLARDEPPASFQAQARRVLSLAFNRDGSRLVTAGGAGIVRVWDARTFATLRELPAHSPREANAALFLEPGRIVTGGGDRSIKVWDEETGDLIETIEDLGRSILALGASPDGRRFASVGLDRSLRIFDAQTLEPILTLADVDLISCPSNANVVGPVYACGEDRTLVKT